MTITSFLFLFIFLPISIAIYYISPSKIKDATLLILSFGFYGLASQENLKIFVIATFLNVILGRSLYKIGNPKIKKALFITGIALNVIFLFYYKYMDFAIININKLTSAGLPLKNLLLPLGISFFTFKAISYLADIYTGKAQLSPNWLHDAVYLSFFAQVQSGPLTRYNDSKAISAKHIDLNNLGNGTYRFLIGFNKKILIANMLAGISAEAFGASPASMSSAYAWLGSVSFSLQLFFDFAGYSDMAIGLSQIFGYSCKENFNYPYMTESVTRFWRRWHISLSEWFRDYIYIPLGGSMSSSKFRVYFNLFVVWALTGIWHGAAWTFVVWGLGYFLIIAFERLTNLPKRLKFFPFKILYRILTLAFINFQWVFFNSASVTYGVSYIKRMIIPCSNSLSDTRFIFLLRNYAYFLVVAIVLCFPIIPYLDKKTSKNKIVGCIYEILKDVIILIGFVWSVSMIASGQNNPFAYANF